MITVRFSQSELNRELNTVMASRAKNTGGSRTPDRKFQAFGILIFNIYLY